MGRGLRVLRALVKASIFFLFFINKKQYIDQKNQEVPKSTQEVKKREPKGNKKETKPPPTKGCQPYVHPSKAKKSIKEVLLTTLYKSVQFHRLLKKLDLIF